MAVETYNVTLPRTVYSGKNALNNLKTVNDHAGIAPVKVDGEIIGTASLNRNHNRMRHRGVFGISLKKAWWGCGAASALMEAILAFARENGFEQLNLEVRSSNTRAIRLYEKYGFRKLCTFPHFFKIDGEYIDFDLMNLELNDGCS